MEKGYIHIYTGNGKGKTTAAFGLAIRASGQGYKSYIGQFMKGQAYGEIIELDNHPKIIIEQYGDQVCIRREDVTQKHIDLARKGLATAKEAMLSGQYDIIVLDEINVSIWFGLISISDVLDFLDNKPEHVEIVLTGRKAPEVLIKRADLVTEMLEVKHYYNRGVSARNGIER